MYTPEDCEEKVYDFRVAGIEQKSPSNTNVCIGKTTRIYVSILYNAKQRMLSLGDAFELCLTGTA